CRQRRTAEGHRACAGALRRARPEDDSRRRPRPLRAPRLHRRSDGPLDPRGTDEHGAPRDDRPARARGSRPVHALRHCIRTRGGCDGGREAAAVSPELARAGGVVGAFGLALLLLGTTRERRLVGLGGWAVGMIALGLYLAPSGHHRLLAAAAVVGAVAAGVLAYLFVRRPWLLAVAVLACVPARIPVHVGLTEANLLLPLYGVVVAAALALVWELFG